MRMQENPTPHRRTMLIRDGAVITHRSPRERSRNFDSTAYFVASPNHSPLPPTIIIGLYFLCQRNRKGEWDDDWNGDTHTSYFVEASALMGDDWVREMGLFFYSSNGNEKRPVYFSESDWSKNKNRWAETLKSNKQTTNQQLLKYYTLLLFVSTEQIITNTIRPDCIWNRVKKWMTAAAAVNYFLK